MKMHRCASRSRQRGLSLFGLVFFAALALVVVIVGGRSVPIITEYLIAKKTIEEVKLQGSVVNVREAFDRAATINGVRSIKGADLEVTERGGKMVVSFKYSREIALIGPAYLTYRFAAQTN